MSSEENEGNYMDKMITDWGYRTREAIVNRRNRTQISGPDFNYDRMIQKN
jgi:hypothetical protein